MTVGARIDLLSKGHRSQTEEEYRKASYKILILGAGFGGIQAAIELDKHLGKRQDVSILVVDRDNTQLFQPLLWTVASGKSCPDDATVPIRKFQKGRSFHVMHSAVKHIDLQNQVVYFDNGEDRPFDFLVIALGSVTAIPNLPGLRERALLFRSPADAIELRNKVIDALETAHKEQDPEARKSWLTFVVGGGGDTGIELAATLKEYIYAGLFAEYPWLENEPARIVLVSRSSRLVPQSRPHISKTVQEVLEHEGIEVMNNTSVEAVTEDEVKTSAGTIKARTLFWAAGITAPKVVKDLPVEHARNGSLIVDKFLRIPQYPNVFVVGDSAWAFDARTNDPIPPTAQAAEHMGRYVGRTISSLIQNRSIKPFVFKPLGHLALLGQRTGVAEVGPLTFTGIPAWFIWHSYYLMHIPSWRNRIYLFTHWLLSLILGRETGQLRLSPGVLKEGTQ